MSKSASTKFVNLMASGSGVLVLGRGSIGYIVKMHLFFEILSFAPVFNAYDLITYLRPGFILFSVLQTLRSRFWIFRKKKIVFLSDVKFESGSRFQIYDLALPVFTKLDPRIKHGLV